MHELIEDLKTRAAGGVPKRRLSDSRGAIDEAFQKKQGEAFSSCATRPREKSIVILRTPVGLRLAPAANGEVVPPDEFNAWPEAKRGQVQDDIAALEKDLEHIVRQIPQWDKQRRDEVRELNRETAKYAVDHLIEEVKAEFADCRASPSIWRRCAPT